MTDLNARIEKAKKDMSGIESLYEMLEGDAAADMFNWGQELAASIASDTDGLEDAAAEEALASRLKALRKTLRSIGNWAAGKYTDPSDRDSLKGNLLENLQAVLGEKSKHLTPGELNEVIDLVDKEGQAAHRLIQRLKEVIASTG